MKRQLATRRQSRDSKERVVWAGRSSLPVFDMDDSKRENRNTRASFTASFLDSTIIKNLIPYHHQSIGTDHETQILRKVESVTDSLFGAFVWDLLVQVTNLTHAREKVHAQVDVEDPDADDDDDGDATPVVHRTSNQRSSLALTSSYAEFIPKQSGPESRRSRFHLDVSLEDVAMLLVGIKRRHVVMSGDVTHVGYLFFVMFIPICALPTRWRKRNHAWFHYGYARRAFQSVIRYSTDEMLRRVEPIPPPNCEVPVGWVTEAMLYLGALFLWASCLASVWLYFAFWYSISCSDPPSAKTRFDDVALSSLVVFAFLSMGPWLFSLKQRLWETHMQQLSLVSVMATISTDSADDLTVARSSISAKGLRKKYAQSSYGDTEDREEPGESGTDKQAPSPRPYTTAHDLYTVSIARKRAQSARDLRGGGEYILLFSLFQVVISVLGVNGWQRHDVGCLMPSIVLGVVRAVACAVMYLATCESHVAWCSAADAVEAFGSLTREQWRDGVCTRRLDLHFPENSAAWTAIRVQLISELPHHGPADVLLVFVTGCWLVYGLRLLLYCAFWEGDERIDSVAVVALHTAFLTARLVSIFAAGDRVTSALDQHVALIRDECSRLSVDRDTTYSLANNANADSSVAVARLQYEPRYLACRSSSIVVYGNARHLLPRHPGRPVSIRLCCHQASNLSWRYWRAILTIRGRLTKSQTAGGTERRTRLRKSCTET